MRSSSTPPIAPPLHRQSKALLGLFRESVPEPRPTWVSLPCSMFSLLFFFSQRLLANQKKKKGNSQQVPLKLYQKDWVFFGEEHSLRIVMNSSSSIPNVFFFFHLFLFYSEIQKYIQEVGESPFSSGISQRSSCLRCAPVSPKNKNKKVPHSLNEPKCIGELVRAGVSVLSRRSVRSHGLSSPERCDACRLSVDGKKSKKNLKKKKTTPLSVRMAEAHLQTPPILMWEQKQPKTAPTAIHVACKQPKLQYGIERVFYLKFFITTTRIVEAVCSIVSILSFFFLLHL